MKVLLAKSAGFCYGVKRAVELAAKTGEETGGCWMLGDLIHNSHVVEDLARRGVRRTEDPANLTAEKLAEYQKAQGAVSSALGKLLAVTENYPQLRANENFSELQAQLEGTENRITEARKRYNEAVQDYNVLIRKFPNNLFAGMFGFSKKEKFEASSGASEAPKVEF